MMQTITENGVKVVTKYPVFINKRKVSPVSYYANATGDGKSLIEKAQANLDKLNQSGILELGQSISDTIKGKGKKTDSTVNPAPAAENKPVVEEKKKGMSTMTKYVLVAAGVGVVAFFGYKYFNKKK